MLYSGLKNMLEIDILNIRRVTVFKYGVSRLIKLLYKIISTLRRHNENWI
jgi:hypothetical protein